MASYDYSQVEVILVDLQLNTLRLIRDVLGRLRMAKIQNFSTYAGVSEALTLGSTDLLLIDADHPDSEAFHIVRTLRNDPGSRNPFPCVMMTTWQPTAAMVSQAVNVGADDLLVKPISPRQLLDRIQGLVENRKNFVVTVDYVGPDRRKAPRPGLTIPLLEVPNTMRLKAAGQWSKVDGNELISGALSRLREQKLRRNSFQIAFLAEAALPGLRQTPPDRTALDHLERIPTTIDDLDRRYLPGEMEPRLDLALKSVRGVVDRIRTCVVTAAPDSDLNQLQRQVYGPMSAIFPNRAVEDLQKEVRGTVAAYRARLAELAAARNASPPPEERD